MDMETRRPVGAVFRWLREQRGLTQDAVAGAINWDAPNLSRSERGLQELTEARLYQLAAYFGIRPSDAYAIAESGIAEDGEVSSAVAAELISFLGDLDDTQRQQLLDFARFLRKKNE